MFSKLLRHIMVDQDMKQVQVADLIGCSQSAFSQRLQRDSFTETEMRRILDSLGYDLVLDFQKKV